MQVYTQQQARAFVFTRREGLLGRLGHDLKLRVERFTVELDEATGHLLAQLDARSVQVVCAMQDGKDSLEPITVKDRADIEKNLRSVLEPDRHPQVTLQVDGAVVTAGGFTAQGRLLLHGRSQMVTVAAHKDARGWEGETTVRQSAFGIKPFTAMMGALAVRDEIVLRLVIPV